MVRKLILFAVVAVAVAFVLAVRFASREREAQDVSGDETTPPAGEGAAEKVETLPGLRPKADGSTAETRTVKDEPRQGPPVLELRACLRDSARAEAVGAEFLVGEDLFLYVTLRSSSYAEAKYKLQLEAEKAALRRARGIKDDVREDAPEAPLTSYHLVVGRPGKGWTEHVSIQVDRIHEDSNGPKVEKVLDDESPTGAVVIVRERHEHILKMRLEAEWQLKTSDLKPGRYRVTTVFEIDREEARDLKTRQCRAARQDEFWLRAQGAASRAAMFRSCYAKARKAYSEHRVAECIEEAEKALRWALEYDTIRTYRLLGEAYEAKQDYAKALHCYERAVKSARKLVPTGRTPELLGRRIRYLEEKVKAQGAGDEE